MMNTANQNQENHFSLVRIPESIFDEKTIYDHKIRDNWLAQRFIHQMNQGYLPSITCLKQFSAAEYLHIVQPFVHKKFINPTNYAEIEKLASFFTGGITSFFGFETCLHSPEASSDYLFAVSSLNGEREALAQLLTNGSLPESFMQQSAWQRLRDFSEAWINPWSELYDNVLGLWLEFDMATNLAAAPVPSVFIHMKPFRINSKQDISNYVWLTQTALPLLCGGNISDTLEQQFSSCVSKMPGKAMLLDVGVMLSRSAQGLRLVIIRLQPDEIIPYLESLGWKDTDNGLAHVISEVKNLSSRLVLHINITEDGVDPKIGLECSYAPDQYHLEQNWPMFFNYLISKGACLPEKQKILLDFLGVTHQNQTQEFSFQQYKPSVKIDGNVSDLALVRYLSHIKIVYTYGNTIEAKAYPGVRLFGSSQTENSSYQ